jgi:GMP synthase (glutamine-hydrolysing)
MASLNDNEKDKILIIDFGSQVTKLIARRVRDLGVYSEIISSKNLPKLNNYQNIRGIILSGGPSTVTKVKFPSISKEIFEKKIPILGICYGLQLIAKLFGGKIKSSKKRREFGRAILLKRGQSLLTKNFFTSKKSVWMSHEDVVIKIPKNFRVIASTKNSRLTIIENTKKKIYGVQFHPEVTHTDNGKKIFKNFLF